ncbi:MAG: hypothetical protein IKR85_05820 [Clostridia bacterium]|nr:hypothetical protein [Clostridia bacterium]
MKRILALVVCAFMLISCALAEDYDLEGMDFDSLLALKEAVDREYYSRQEAKGISFAPGTYIVGIDIKPGRYYVKMVEPSPDGSALVNIDKDLETYGKRLTVYAEISLLFTSLDSEQKNIRVESGNVLEIEHGSILFSSSPINQDDYYVYRAPEGTYVPSGVYIVGEDIPAGKYNVYSGTIHGGYARIFYSKETYDKTKFKTNDDEHVFVEVRSTDYYQTITLENGYYVKVERDIVMKKSDYKKPILSFD